MCVRTCAVDTVSTNGHAMREKMLPSLQRNGEDLRGDAFVNVQLITWLLFVF